MTPTPDRCPPGDDDARQKSPAEIVMGVAHQLAAHHPSAWARLLAEHVPTASGHCRACHWTSHGSPVWPCTLRVIAERAERLSAGHGRA